MARADGRTRNELDITMTVETVVLGDAENRATLLPVSPGIALVAGSAIAFRSEIAHFLRVVRGEDTNFTPPRSGINAVEIAEAAALSRLTDAPVLLPSPIR